MSAPKFNKKKAGTYVADLRVRIGHVHLKVADLARAVGFYHEVLGLEIMQRLGDSAIFLSAGGYHHHLALNTWESLGGSPPGPGTTGLYHTAIVYPSRAALAEALRRVLAAGIPLEGAADHGVSESIYLRDPDHNGVELYCDRPKELWPRTPDGRLAMYTHPLDVNGLLGEPEADVELSEGPKDL
jgi:catechol 2,3-dioxygenase